MQQAKYSSSERGFSIVEVCVAMGLLTVVSLGVAQLFAASTRINVMARGQSFTTIIAAQKLEQIRSLTWGFDKDGMGLPVTDVTTNLTVYPLAQNGTGLNASPEDALERNTAGFVDYVDATGNWVGTGLTPPATAVYIRRWLILPLPSNPNNTLVIEVLVTPISNEHARVASQWTRTRMAGDALLITVKTRKAS
jgi:type II secretory pathway pseudopilin PulG